MNWLAHAFLSEDDVEFQIGNVLADPLKGKVWQSASDGIIKGMKTHVLIDVFTDSHQVVSKSKSRLRERGLLKAVVIDITYDYFLTKHWHKYSSISKDDFLVKFNDEARSHFPQYPEQAKIMVESLVKENRLDKYNTLSQLRDAFVRIDTRLSPKLLARENTLSYFDRVCEIELDLEEDFLNFFPALYKYIKAQLDPQKLRHWK